jgi:hypothetical protein
MKQAYITQRFNRSSIDIINKSNSIFIEYSKQGYQLTLRQLYYQFIARDLFPESKRYSWTGKKWIKDKNGTKNCQPNYKFLGQIINNARLCGLIDWNYLHDLTRNLRKLSTWKNPAEIIDSAMSQYRIDKWKNQDYHIEVWVEKDALIQVVGKASTYYEVSYFSCRGYVSQSAMYETAQRLIHSGKKNIIFHLGDHDPSGIDMTRDIKDRLTMFKTKVKIKRLALNMNQIKKYNPPPSPAKTTDSRYESYIEQFGNDSWELDALEPNVIENLIKSNIKKYINQEKWKETIIKQNRDKNLLRRIIDDLENGEYE